MLPNWYLLEYSLFPLAKSYLMYQNCTFYNTSSTPWKGWPEEEWWQWRTDPQRLCSSWGWSRRRSGNHHSPSPQRQHPSLSLSNSFDVNQYSYSEWAGQPELVKWVHICTHTAISQHQLKLTHPRACKTHHNLNKSDTESIVYTFVYIRPQRGSVACMSAWRDMTLSYSTNKMICVITIWISVLIMYPHIQILARHGSCPICFSSPISSLDPCLYNGL